MDHRHDRARPVVAVVYDNGSVGPAEIAAAAAACGVDVRFVIDRTSPHVAQLAPVLTRRFAVCDVTGTTVRQAVAAWRPDGIVTFSDLCMRTTARLADGWGLKHWHTPELTELLTDKLAQRRALAAAGVDSTRSVEVSTVDELPGALATVGLPAVLKPRRGTGGRHVHRVDDVTGARDAARRYFADRPDDDPLLVEELLRGDPTVAGDGWGDYLSVDAVLHEGRFTPLCVVGKFPLAPPFRERGFFLPATVDADTADAVVAVTRDAVRALGVRHGIVHAELKLTVAGPRILEVNGRVGGHVPDLLRRAGGPDAVALALRTSLGQTPQTRPPTHPGVTYQYVLLPPCDATALRSVDGLAALRAVDGVDIVDVRATSGPVDWRDGAFGRLGKVYGRVADHHALAGVAALIESTFRPVFAHTGHDEMP